MTSFDAANMPFVVRAPQASPATKATPKNDANAGRPTQQTTSTTPNAFRVAEQAAERSSQARVVDNQQIKQQQQALSQAQVARGETPQRVNIFAAAAAAQLYGENKLKNGASNVLYSSKNTAAKANQGERRSLDTGFGGTDFGGLFDQSGAEGPSNAIDMMARFSLAEDPNFRQSLS